MVHDDIIRHHDIREEHLRSFGKLSVADPEVKLSHRSTFAFLQCQLPTKGFAASRSLPYTLQLPRFKRLLMFRRRPH